MKKFITIISVIFWSSLSLGTVPQEDSHMILSCECWEEAHPDYSLIKGGSVSYSGYGGIVEGSGDTQEEALLAAMEVCQAAFPIAEEEPYIRSCRNGEEMVCASAQGCDYQLGNYLRAVFP